MSHLMDSKASPSPFRDPCPLALISQPSIYFLFKARALKALAARSSMGDSEWQLQVTASPSALRTARRLRQLSLRLPAARTNVTDHSVKFLGALPAGPLHATASASGRADGWAAARGDGGDSAMSGPGDTASMPRALAMTRSSGLSQQPVKHSRSSSATCGSDVVHSRLTQTSLASPASAPPAAVAPWRQALPLPPCSLPPALPPMLPSLSPARTSSGCVGWWVQSIAAGSNSSMGSHTERVIDVVNLLPVGCSDGGGWLSQFF